MYNLIDGTTNLRVDYWSARRKRRVVACDSCGINKTRIRRSYEYNPMDNRIERRFARVVCIRQCNF